MTEQLPLIFDGHNDILTHLLGKGGVDNASSFLTGLNAHLDSPKAKKGGFGGGFFAMWVESPSDGQDYQSMMAQVSYDLPLPEPLDQQDALRVIIEEAAILRKLESIGALKVCTTTEQLRTCLQSGTIASIMHMEGAEAIDASLYSLELLYHAGLRSLGPVWSRPTLFAEGVPFRYPSSPDIGGGLTRHGIALVKRCNELGIMIDLSHLNEAGYWDVVKHSTAPIVATHSNAHSICEHSRNLTDQQLDAIKDSQGMVGVNFATCFLRTDGQMKADVSLDQVIRHIDYLMNKVGEDCVGFGSDFDGAVIPAEMGDVSGLTHLRRAMRGHGYNEELMTRLCYQNWLRLLDLTWSK